MLQLDIGEKHWKSEYIFINMWLVRDATRENRVWKYIKGKEKSVTIFKKVQGLEIPLWSSGLTARSLSLIPGQGTKIPQAEQYGKKQTKTQRF